MLSYILQTAERNCFLWEEEGTEDADSFVPRKKCFSAPPRFPHFASCVQKNAKKSPSQPRKLIFATFVWKNCRIKSAKELQSFYFSAKPSSRIYGKSMTFLYVCSEGSFAKKPLELWEQNCRITIALHFWKEKDEVRKLQFYLRKNRQIKVRSFASKNIRHFYVVFLIESASKLFAIPKRYPL